MRILLSYPAIPLSCPGRSQNHRQPAADRLSFQIGSGMSGKFRIVASHNAPEGTERLPKLARWALPPWIPWQGFTLATRARKPQKERNKSSTGLFVRSPGLSKGFTLASHPRSCAPWESRSLRKTLPLMGLFSRRRYTANHICSKESYMICATEKMSLQSG